MEWFRYAAKWYTQGHCKHSLGGSTAALSSVASVSINRYYNHCVSHGTEGFKYGTKTSIELVYKGRHQVVG